MYGFSWLPLLLISNFERLLYAQNVRLTFPCSAWLGTIGTRHLFVFVFCFYFVECHVRYQLGGCDPSYMFSLGDCLIFDPYSPTYPIH